MSHHARAQQRKGRRIRVDIQRTCVVTRHAYIHAYNTRVTPRALLLYDAMLMLPDATPCHAAYVACMPLLLARRCRGYALLLRLQYYAFARCLRCYYADYFAAMLMLIRHAAAIAFAYGAMLLRHAGCAPPMLSPCYAMLPLRRCRLRY